MAATSAIATANGLPATFREQARRALALRADELDAQAGDTTWQSWNLSCERVRALVSRQELLR